MPPADQLDAWHAASVWLLDAGLTPRVPAVVARSMWHNGGQARALAEHLHRADAVCT